MLVFEDKLTVKEYQVLKLNGKCRRVITETGCCDVWGFGLVCRNAFIDVHQNHSRQIRSNRMSIKLSENRLYYSQIGCEKIETEIIKRNTIHKLSTLSFFFISLLALLQ